MNFHIRSRSSFAWSILGALPVVFLLLFPWRMALAQAPCDVDHSCVGNALQFPGGDLDYVDVFTTPALERINSSGALTVSLWLAVDRQAGVSQFIAGVWGPRTDRDDQWLLYVDERDSLVFTVSNGTTNLGQFDNTVVRAAAAYGQWMHVAAMWDAASAEARLYIDGRLIATARNVDYPATSIAAMCCATRRRSVHGEIAGARCVLSRPIASYRLPPSSHRRHFPFLSDAYRIRRSRCRWWIPPHAENR